MTQDGDILREPDKATEEVLDELNSNGALSTIDELEKMVNQIIATLPRLNVRKLRLEMEGMQVGLQQNPTTLDLNAGLSKAQGYKDRLAEIYTMALREFKTRKRCVDLLFDAFNHVSKGSSADKRRGEATMKYPMLLLHMEAAETFLDEVEHILHNIKSAMEAISRQVTLMQIQVQLGEVRRGAQPSNYEAEEVRNKNGGVQEKAWEDI